MNSKLWVLSTLLFNEINVNKKFQDNTFYNTFFVNILLTKNCDKTLTDRLMDGCQTDKEATTCPYFGEHKKDLSKIFKGKMLTCIIF